MALVATMGHVYAMITIMELTAQVNQYFCYFAVIGKCYSTTSKFEVSVTALFFFLIFDSCM